ncbi:MAG: hypothetical protein ACLFUU_13210 [Desulfobacteraceae bacterium]
MISTLPGEWPWVDILGLFVHLAGFVIGLGAVTVIDLHGFRGRNSPYWTEATIRTHKITKPLIWCGLFLAIVGASIYHRHHEWTIFLRVQAAIAVLLVLNGIFLSFRVSPFLLQRERAGRAQELLPAALQHKIILAFIISFGGWWTGLLLTVIQVLTIR